MKVTVICEVRGTANNGTSVAAYNLINYLKSRGHEVTVVCPDEQHRGEPGYAILPPTNLTMFSGIFEKNNVVLSRYDEEIITNAIKDADVVHILVPLFISRKTSKLVNR